MRPIVLKDRNDQRLLNRDGYVAIDLLKDDDVSRLRDIYGQSFDRSVNGFTSTNLINSKSWRRELAARISDVICPPLLSVAQDCKFWLPAFLIKPHGEDTEFRPHQDWTFVDEKKYVSGNVWVPLSDTDEQNGTLCFIKGSHHLCLKTFRVQAMPLFFEGNEDFLKQYCTPVPVKAGQAIVFYHSIIHYSPPNMAPHDRIAVSCGFHSAEAPLMFYHRAAERSIEEYLMLDDFVFDFDDVESLSRRPVNGHLNRTFDHEQRVLTRNELSALFQRGAESCFTF